MNVIHAVRSVALLDVALLAVLDLVLVAGTVGWLLEGLWRAAAQFVRAGEVDPDQGRQLLLRGALGLTAYAVSALLTQLTCALGQRLR